MVWYVPALLELHALCRSGISILAGFYLDAELFPGKKGHVNAPDLLLLGPFSGKPACQFIYAQAGKGVCADAFVSRMTIVAPNVGEYRLDL